MNTPNVKLCCPLQYWLGSSMGVTLLRGLCILALGACIRHGIDMHYIQQLKNSESSIVPGKDVQLTWSWTKNERNAKQRTNSQLIHKQYREYFWGGSPSPIPTHTYLLLTCTASTHQKHLQLVLSVRHREADRWFTDVRGAAASGSHS